LGTDRFAQFCRERGLSIDRERLIRLERLGLFTPVFRVQTPKKDTSPFDIPVNKDNNWFEKKWAWDTTGVPLNYKVPDHKDQTQEGYYSIFQIDYLDTILQKMTLQVNLDLYLDQNEEKNIDWRKNGENWMQYAASSLEILQTLKYRRSVALLCQFISNRYYPNTQGDQRMTQVRSKFIYSDQWIRVINSDYNWYEEIRNWNPKAVERLFELSPENLLHAFETLAIAQRSCDPLEHWYQLTQFVCVSGRKKLKGDALRAETSRAGAEMLRLLHKNLYGEELPHPNEVGRIIRTHIPELHVREDPRRYLEFVVNRFGLNPQPKLSLIVEGQSEEIAVKKIFEEYFGTHVGKYSIEIIVLGGVDAATGSTEDRFRAILRLIDYLHHHQTITFLVLDNENYAEKLKQEAYKAKSIHGEQRYVTKPEHIHIWKDSFEFDNFSCEEIAAAMNKLAQDHANFTNAEVFNKKDSNSGSSLKKLYEKKTQYGLKKIKLCEILIENMMSPDAFCRTENRPIIKILEYVACLADGNPLPVMHETWKKNQGSNYLGRKREDT